MIAFLLTTLTFIAALLAVYYARIEPKYKKKRALFIKVRRHLKNNVADIVSHALLLHKELRAYPEIPLLTRNGWILTSPKPLDSSITLKWSKEDPPSIHTALKKICRYWPYLGYNDPAKNYHQSIEKFDKPKNWFNGVSYRLIEVKPNATNSALEQTFCKTNYWDMIDTTESLFYEAAFIHMKSQGSKIVGPYRKYLQDPFNLKQRCAIPGIDALTIRLEKNSPTFYVHRRKAEDVASAVNTIGIIPAGEFQPSDDSHQALTHDFKLWYSILREYVEEFLNYEDARNRVGAPINYKKTAPYSDIQKAYETKQISTYVLGIGLDPVTWKPTILTVNIINSSIFDYLFSDMVSENKEGLLELPFREPTINGSFKGLPFNRDTIQLYSKDLNVLPAARAGLILAWKFRKELGFLHTTS